MAHVPTQCSCSFRACALARRAAGEDAQRERRAATLESSWTACSSATPILSLPRGDGERDVQFVLHLDDAADGDGRDAEVGLFDDELAGGGQLSPATFTETGAVTGLRLAVNGQLAGDRQVERGRRALSP